MVNRGHYAHDDMFATTKEGIKVDVPDFYGRMDLKAFLDWIIRFLFLALIEQRLDCSFCYSQVKRDCTYIVATSAGDVQEMRQRRGFDICRDKRNSCAINFS